MVIICVSGPSAQAEPDPATVTTEPEPSHSQVPPAVAGEGNMYLYYIHV